MDGCSYFIFERNQQPGCKVWFHEYKLCETITIYEGSIYQSVWKIARVGRFGCATKIRLVVCVYFAT